MPRAGDSDVRSRSPSRPLHKVQLPALQRRQAAKNALPHKDATEQAENEKPSARPNMPIDQATMTGPGSSLALNGSTFQVELRAARRC